MHWETTQTQSGCKVQQTATQHNQYFSFILVIQLLIVVQDEMYYTSVMDDQGKGAKSPSK